MQQYNGNANLEDMGVGLYIDGSGNVYVVGTTSISTTNSDIITIKYDSSGTQQWLRTYDGTGNSFDSGADIVVDSNGDVYITGSSYNTTPNTDMVTIKYNSSGTQQWATTYNYTSNMNDAGVKISVTINWVSISGIVQTGITTYKWCTMIVNKSTGAYSNGRISSNSSTGIDQVNDMVEDASGNIYIVGATPVSGQGYNYDIIKLTSALALAWEVTYNGGDNLDDIGKGIKVDSYGNVFVTGYSTSSTEGRNITTLKYQSNGTLEWEQTINDSLNGNDEASAMAMDADGNIYITGYINTEIDSADFFTVKYDIDGNVIWQIENDGLNHLNDKATNIAIDDDGNVIVTGSSETSPGVFQYLAVKYVEKDIIIPTDYNGEEPSSSFLYYQNSGQIADVWGDPISNIKYYVKSHSPEFYIKNYSYSMLFSNVNEISRTTDTLFRIDVGFQKCNETTKAYPLNEQKEYANFFLPQCSSGITEVHGNQRLVVPELYSNIDLMYSSNQNGIKFYYIVKPGGDPNAIRMYFEGADSVRINGQNNNLTIYSSIGSLSYERPTVYQLDANNQVDTITGWTADWIYDSSNDAYYFYSDSYNTSLPLIIQVDLGHTQQQQQQSNGNLTWSTYITTGTSSNPGDYGYGICKDNAGNTYTVGQVFSNNFPADNGIYIYSGRSDGYLIKFNSQYEKKYTTFFGGSDNDNLYDIDYNLVNNSIYAIGNTYSTNIPIRPYSNPNNGTYYQSQGYGNWDNDVADAYILRFDLATTNGSPIWSSYIGGAGNDKAKSIVVAKTGDVAVGITTSTNTGESSCIAPQSGGLSICNGSNQYKGGNSDVYFIKFNYNNELIFSSFYGGNGSDDIQDLCLGSSSIIGVGSTSSTNFYTYPSGSYFVTDDCPNSIAGFIFDFGLNNQMKWSTTIPYLSDIQTVDYRGNFTYIVGIPQGTVYQGINTCSYDQNGISICHDNGGHNQTQVNGPDDIYIACFNDKNLYWSTFYGGTTDEGSDFYDNTDLKLWRSKYIDCSISDYNFYVMGITSKLPGYSFPLLNYNGFYYDNYNNGSEGASDVFFLGFDYGNELFWSTLFGGGDDNMTLVDYSSDFGGTMKVYNDNIYMTGWTYTPNYPDACPGSGAYCQLAPPQPNPSWPLGAVSTVSVFDLQNAPIGFNELTADNNSLCLFPNPSYDKVYIKSSIKINKYEIYNSIGQKISEGNYNINEGINVKSFAKGIYWVKIFLKEKFYLTNFVKE